MKLLTSAPELEAVRAALRELVVAGDGRRHRTWAVLGPVAGATRDELLDLGRHVVRLGVAALVAFGDAAGDAVGDAVGDAGAIHAGAVLEGSWGDESRHVDDADAAVALLRAHLDDDDVVLVAGVPEVLALLRGMHHARVPAAGRPAGGAP